MKTSEAIEKLNPCVDGAKYLRKHETLETAWEHCPRGDWMLWLARKLNADIRMLTLAKGLCASTVKHLMKDKRSVVAIESAIAFGRGEIGQKELDAAASTAYAAYASYANAAAYAAYAASYANAATYAYAAADAASYAAYVAAAAADADATYAAAAAYTAAADAAAYAARDKNRLETANICRKILSGTVFAKIAALEAAERV
jgi:hypothetical protein